MSMTLQRLYEYNQVGGRKPRVYDQNWQMKRLSKIHEDKNIWKMTYTDLICPTRLREISYPLDTVIVALLEHFEEPYNKSRRGEHQDLEVHVDRRTRPYLTVGRAGQLCSTSEAHFGTSLYTRYPTKRRSNAA